MKKIIKAYCVSKIEKGVRSFQEEDQRRWSTDMRNACMYKDKKECESWIKDDIESWKIYQTYCPDFELPKYEIVELELRVVKCIPQ